MNDEYSDKMIEAYINKPSVTLWYQNSFSKFNVSGIETMKWNWSWWAFGGGFLYLLYRKEYLASLILFVVSMLVGAIPFLSVVIMILSGGYGSYFVYKGYKKRLQEVENAIEDEEERVAAMRELGGYNQWVIWVYGILMTLLFVIILSVIMPIIN